MKIHRDINNIKGIHNPVLTVGTFDGVHIGHQKIIQRINEIAAQEGGESVLLTFHPHPRMVLFPEDDSLKLINTIAEKSELLEQFGLKHVIYMPFVKELSRMSPVAYVRDILVNKINIDTIVIGYDHHFGCNRQGNLDLLKELAPLYEFKVEEIPAQEIEEIAVSSTKIRNAILQGNIAIANEYLGYKVKLTGTVVKGKQLGRSINFPTANIKVTDKHKIIPKNGVYAVSSNINNRDYLGMLNIGTKPTVTDDNITTVEVHFFDFDDDLYSKEISISFLRFIRSEKTFENIAALQSQLRIDEKIIRELSV